MVIKIKMLQSLAGSNDGKDVKMYYEGEVHEVSEDLANCFFSTKAAEPFKEEALKSEKKAPKNKAEAEAPLNKGAE